MNNLFSSLKGGFRKPRKKTCVRAWIDRAEERTETWQQWENSTTLPYYGMMVSSSLASKPDKRTPSFRSRVVLSSLLIAALPSSLPCFCPFFSSIDPFKWNEVLEKLFSLVHIHALPIVHTQTYTQVSTKPSTHSPTHTHPLTNCILIHSSTCMLSPIHPHSLTHPLTYTQTHSHGTFPFMCFILTYLIFLLDKIPLKARTGFNDSQRSVLQQCFANNAYLTKETLKNISQLTGLSARSVSTWFFNKRKLSRKEILGQQIPSS